MAYPRFNQRLIIYLVCGILIVIGIFLLCRTSKGQVPAQNLSLETQNTIQLARSFLKDHRYQETVSLLDGKLQTLSPTEPRFPLLLLLADGLMGVGDFARAETIINEADDLAVRPQDERAVAKRRKVLSEQLAQKPAAPAPTGIDTTIKVQTEPQKVWPTITNSFFETDLRQVLSDLSMEANIPIQWDATVQGLVTYEAVDQPLDDVLKAVLSPLGYTYSYQDGIFYVGSVKPEDPAFGLLSKTEIMTLSNIKATDAIGLLSDFFQPYVKASNTSNMVCITAPPTMIKRIREDLTTLDEPADQILIEVVVSEINRDALREMGLDWSLNGLKDNPVWDAEVNNTDIENPGMLWNYSELGVDIGDYTIDLMASLEAMVQSGEAEIRANPRITTLNGQPAEISMTTDQYFIIQTSTSQTYQYNTLQSVSSGISLEITPYTSASGEITVYVNPSVGDVVGKGANDLPEINTRAAKTSVRVMDGETFSIGGLSLQKKKNIRNKIPFLGDIPILGYLFRYDHTETKNSEIVIFVTPHILNG